MTPHEHAKIIVESILANFGVTKDGSDGMIAPSEFEDMKAYTIRSIADAILAARPTLSESESGKPVAIKDQTLLIKREAISQIRELSLVGNCDEIQEICFNLLLFSAASPSTIQELSRRNSSRKGRAGMNDNEEILSCPFCGVGMSVCDTDYDDTAKRWRVWCGKCGSSSGVSPRAEGSKEAAIKSWNTRDGKLAYPPPEARDEG